MYNETMYLNYTDLNAIEERIEELTEELQQYSPTTPTFVAKIWQVNEFPYIQEIQRIETGVDNFRKYWYAPDGWIKTKKWLNGNETEQVIKIFNFEDINRWIINMDVVEPVFGDNTNIWNVQSFINWDEESNVDWSDR